ncbi:MAG: putative acetyltransferase [Syntrophorhabdus sp. PtaU1.Bin153]|nr:MAG: putative acetyltransferase [Syntrophorhabdus sp. PtaU1.Bin153]
MRNPKQFLKNSSIAFSAFRAVEYAVRKLADGVYTHICRTALGACGAGTRIAFGVPIVLPKRVFLGKDCYISQGCKLTTEIDSGVLKIGDNAVIAPNCRLDFSGGLEIGDDLLVSPGVFVLTHDHSTIDYKQIKTSFLRIGSHVWIGANTIILPSVSMIGSNVVIGAGSVLTKNVPDGAIVAGNPAKIIENQ